MMTIETNDTAVQQKTRELCETLLAEPTVIAIRQRIDQFMADDKARAQYEAVMAKGQALHEKQHQSQPLSSEEIAAFEGQRDALMANPVARDFLDAQEELSHLQESIQKQVAKTLELGRLPLPEDLESGCCNHGGCGCKH